MLLFQSIFSPSLPSPNFIKRLAVDQLAWEYYFFPHLIKRQWGKKGIHKKIYREAMVANAVCVWSPTLNPRWFTLKPFQLLQRGAELGELCEEFYHLWMWVMVWGHVFDLMPTSYFWKFTHEHATPTGRISLQVNLSHNVVTKATNWGAISAILAPPVICCNGSQSKMALSLDVSSASELLLKENVSPQ